MFASTTHISSTSGLAQIASQPKRPSPSSRVLTVSVQARRGGDAAIDPEARALINMARRRVRTTPPASAAVAAGKLDIDSDADFITKLKAAWRIFFPERPRPLSPKDEGKKRLRMILVADRCGMSSDSLVGMRESIVRAMSDFVEVESEDAVEVNLSMDPDIGTVYSVAVPVRRVKPSMRPPMQETTSPQNAGAWDPTDPESDPADQFPFGT